MAARGDRPVMNCAAGARVGDERLHVVEQRAELHAPCRHRLAATRGPLSSVSRPELGEQHAPILSHEELALVRGIGIAQLDAHQEAIELRLGQRKGAHLLDRILRRNDEEGFGQADDCGRRR